MKVKIKSQSEEIGAGVAGILRILTTECGRKFAHTEPCPAVGSKFEIPDTAMRFLMLNPEWNDKIKAKVERQASSAR
jgi:hypothetical protein